MKKSIQFILYLVDILYLPCIVVISLFADQSGSFLVFHPLFLMLILFLFTFHFFCIFLEIGFTALRLFEKKVRSKGEKILNISTISLSAIMLIVTLADPEREFFILALILSLILIALWIIGDIIFKQRKFFPELFKKKYFWLSATSLLAAFCITIAITTGKIGDKGQPDPIEPINKETHEVIK